MDAHVTREARLNAVKRLLDYLISESEGLQLPELGNVLENAVRAVEQSLGRSSASRRPRARRRGIRLVVDHTRPPRQGSGAKA